MECRLVRSFDDSYKFSRSSIIHILASFTAGSSLLPPFILLSWCKLSRKGLLFISPSLTVLPQIHECAYFLSHKTTKCVVLCPYNLSLPCYVPAGTSISHIHQSYGLFSQSQDETLPRKEKSLHIIIPSSGLGMLHVNQMQHIIPSFINIDSNIRRYMNPFISVALRIQFCFITLLPNFYLPNFSSVLSFSEFLPSIWLFLFSVSMYMQMSFNCFKVDIFFISLIKCKHFQFSMLFH